MVRSYAPSHLCLQTEISVEVTRWGWNLVAVLALILYYELNHLPSLFTADSFPVSHMHSCSKLSLLSLQNHAVWLIFGMFVILNISVVQGLEKTGLNFLIKKNWMLHLVQDVMFRDSWTWDAELLRCFWETVLLCLWFGPTVHSLCCSSASLEAFSSHNGCSFLLCEDNLCVSSHFVSVLMSFFSPYACLSAGELWTADAGRRLEGKNCLWLFIFFF